MASSRPLHLVLAGCVHGAFDQLYAEVAALERSRGPVDLVLCTGDLQTPRTPDDVRFMRIPPQHRAQPFDFAAYHQGTRRAPYPTICIGGNHEASNVLLELYNGGWLAENIYFLGSVGCVRFGGVRIAGASGIFNRNDTNKPCYHPALECARVALYHTRRAETERLKALRGVDVMLSHDWPQRVVLAGDRVALYRKHPNLEPDGACLGNPLHREVLDATHPTLWVAGHLHARYEAEEGGTRFVALAKVGGDGFIEDCFVDARAEQGLAYDPDWVCNSVVTWPCYANERAFPVDAQRVRELLAGRNEETDARIVEEWGRRVGWTIAFTGKSAEEQFVASRNALREVHEAVFK